MNHRASCFIMQCLVLSFLLSSCQNKERQNQTEEMRVKVAVARQSEASNRKEYPFIAAPLRTSTLSFRVSGLVDRFESYAGNYYKRGSIIAEIDRRDFHLCKEQAEAVYRQAKAEFERMETLYQKNNVSASAYEQARASYVSAKTAFHKAENEVNDTYLLAPFDGYVGETFIERFQEVKATQPVLTLVDISKLRIEVYVTQEVVMIADRLRSVSVSFDHQPNKVYAATVADCARSTTANNLSYRLTVLFPNPDGLYAAGISGKVFFDVDKEMNQVVKIPQTALCHQPSVGDYVWVMNREDHTVSRRQVQKGVLQSDGFFSIEQGLQPNEVVVTTNLRFLSEGMRVQVDDKPYAAPVIASK